MSDGRGSSMPLKASIAYCLAIILGFAAISKLEGPAAFFKAAPAKLLTGADPAYGLAIGLLAGVLGAVASEIFTRKTHWGRALARLLHQILGGLHVVDAILLALLSAVGEELLFRGVLLPYVGLASSSAIFGFAHLVPRKRLWVWSIWATAAGLAFGWMAIATGGLLAPIAAHFAVNAAGLVSISLGRKP